MPPPPPPKPGIPAPGSSARRGAAISSARGLGSTWPLAAGPRPPPRLVACRRTDVGHRQCPALPAQPARLALPDGDLLAPAEPSGSSSSRGCARGTAMGCWLPNGVGGLALANGGCKATGGKSYSYYSRDGRDVGKMQRGFRGKLHRGWQHPYLGCSGRCSGSGWLGARPMSRCCSSTCCRNSETWDCRSSFSWRSRRCRANHFSSSLVRWMSSAVAALLPGSGNTLWLGMRLGTGWWEAGGGCSGCWMGFGVGSTESLSFSGLERRCQRVRGGLPVAIRWPSR